MKLFICIFFLVVIIGPCAKAKSFNFGNFFFGSGKKALDSDPPILPVASEPNIFDNESLDYSAEVDTEGFNLSSDDIFDFDYQNSSSDSLDASNRNDSDDISVSSDNSTASEAEVQNNETQSTDKKEMTTSASSTVASEKTTVEEVPSTANSSNESPGTVTGEQEGVVLGTTTEATSVLIPKTLFQKSIDWVEDAYTLSILIPITAGVLFATTIIVVIALCRCLRRCCRRRNFKRKPLPDSVKNLRPSDRARLLGDTSDEEF